MEQVVIDSETFLLYILDTAGQKEHGVRREKFHLTNIERLEK